MSRIGDELQHLGDQVGQRGFERDVFASRLSFGGQFNLRLCQEEPLKHHGQGLSCRVHVHHAR